MLAGAVVVIVRHTVHEPNFAVVTYTPSRLHQIEKYEHETICALCDCYSSAAKDGNNDGTATTAVKELTTRMLIRPLRTSDSPKPLPSLNTCSTTNRTQHLTAVYLSPVRRQPLIATPVGTRTRRSRPQSKTSLTMILSPTCHLSSLF